MTNREQLRDALIERAVFADLGWTCRDQKIAHSYLYQHSRDSMARVIDALGVVEMAEALDAVAGQKIGWACLVRAAVRKVRTDPAEREDGR